MEHNFRYKYIKYTGKYNCNLNKKCDYENKSAGGSYFNYTGLASPQTLATYNYIEKLSYWCERIRFKTNETCYGWESSA